MTDHTYAKKFVNNKLKMVTINEIYSITINPNDRFQYIKDPRRISKCISRMSKVLSQMSFEYNLYCEISQPPDSQKFPRIHWHGIIQFPTYDSINHFYSVDWFNLSDGNYFNIDTYDPSSKKWPEYCIKEQNTMIHLTQRPRLISLKAPMFTLRQ